VIKNNIGRKNANIYLQVGKNDSKELKKTSNEVDARQTQPKLVSTGPQ